jgi:hypothetical protein
VGEKDQEAKPAEPSSKDVPVEGVKVLWETEPPAVYSNFAVAAARPYGEFSIVFCALSSEYPRLDEDGKLKAVARIVASVRLHPQAFLALVTLLGNTWNNLLDQVGESGSRFQVVPPPGVGATKSEKEHATDKK